jgi:serine/threonine protein kinase
MTRSAQNPASRLGLAPGMTIDGRYHLKRLLGAGGGGEVWEAAEAVDAEAWRSIALKLLKTPERGARHASSGSPTSPEPEHDWLHEARAVSQVSCEALPRIHTVGVVESLAVPFIAMELLEGETLDERLGRYPVQWRKALAIARQIAVALDACHAAGVVHCDLKPRNVFLESTPRRRVLVLDFGVASLGGVVATVARGGGGARSTDETDVQEPDEPVAPGAASPPPIFGTPGYISPERLTGNLPDHRDDAFALGVVLYRMIAGRMPQSLPRGAEAASSSLGNKSGRGTYEIALHRATVERTFVPLEAVRSETPRAVVALVATLLGPASERPAKGQLARLVDEIYRRPHGRPEVPYAGLEAFGKQRMGYLPGREGDVASIVRRLQEQVGLVLCGPSGAGKSSLAIAGVAGRVDEEMLLEMEGWLTVVLRPSSARGGLRVSPSNAPYTPALAGPVGFLVIVDQLEEVLSLGEEEQRAFCRAFTALVTRSAAVDAGDRYHFGFKDPVRVVATVRDDLFGRVAAIPELERLPERNLYVVRGVDPNAAREIVVGPLEGTGYTLEEAKGVDVVGDVARELGRDASALPLVQFALARFWDRRNAGKRVLYAWDWKHIGGIAGALGEAAQRVFEALAPAEKQAARRLFLALFDVEGTRNVVEESALDEAAVALVPRWEQEGLVRRRAEEGGRQVIEPLHEALAKGWPQLSRWLEDVRADRELVREARVVAKRWERNGHPADMLWGETSLENAEVLLGIHEEPASSFVAVSLEAAERARKRGFWVGRVLPAVMAAAVLAGVLIGWWMTNRAKQRADDALDARNTALEESKRSEARAVQSEQEALRQKGVAEREQKETEAAKARVAELGKAYRDELEQLKADLKKAKTQKEFEELQRRIEEKSKPDAGAPGTGRPATRLRKDVGDPFEQ